MGLGYLYITVVIFIVIVDCSLSPVEYALRLNHIISRVCFFGVCAYFYFGASVASGAKISNSFYIIDSLFPTVIGLYL